tara:strand:- start:1446 stop:1928 length:483 start_codon:yes stop_codon:yes gene_type:complete
MKLAPRLFALFLCFSPLGLQAQEQIPFRSNHGEYFYLDSGLIISQHVIEPTFHSSNDWHGMPNLSKANSYRLTDMQTRYLDVQFTSCSIDPFKPQPDISWARNRLKDCLKTHVWENKDIPHWIKVMGTAIALGAASESGALDNKISISIDLTSVHQLLER